MGVTFHRERPAAVVLLMFKNIVVRCKTRNVNRSFSGDGVPPLQAKTTLNIFQRPLIEQLSTVQQPDAVNEPLKLSDVVGRNHDFVSGCRQM